MFGAALIVEFTLQVLPAVASQLSEDIGAVCTVAKRSSELMTSLILLLSTRIPCHGLATILKNFESEDQISWSSPNRVYEDWLGHVGLIFYPSN